VGSRKAEGLPSEASGSTALFSGVSFALSGFRMPRTRLTLLTLALSALTLAACGPADVTVLKVSPNACAFTQRSTCMTGMVQVATDLPEGTELSRPECDSLCLPVNCAGEAKKCSVQKQLDSATPVVVCEPLGC
jgi:hypothetical protein